MNRYISILIGIAFVVSCKSGVEKSNTSSLEYKIDSVLSKLSIEEKLGQMTQISSFYSSEPEKLKEMIRTGKLGSLLNEVTPSTVNELQRVAVEESKHGIPLIFGRDVIHGFKTIFPIPLGQAASWNPSLVEKSSHVAAIEARAKGVTWTFSPMIDVARDPRWGRVAEGYGEDPLLTSILGVAAVKGYQGNDLSANDRIAACAKHFAAYGAAEAGREYNTVITSDQELRNVYLSPFKAATDAGVATFMASFNEINGVPSSGNKKLQTDLLRREWGFKGFVVSDWTSIPEMINHGFANDESHCALIAANAGVDMEMSSNTYIENLATLVNQGKISIDVIDNAVRNILRVKFQLGLFDNPYVDTVKSTFSNDSSLIIAKELALESLVLLKNDKNTLPLNSQIGKVAIVGPMANDRYEQLGTWVFDCDTNTTITPLSAIKSMLSENKVLFAQTLTHSRDNNKGRFAQAKSIASKADAVLVFVGEESILSGEAHGRANINLPGVQTELIEELHKTEKPIIAVIMAGRPLSIKNILPFCDAVIYAWHPGTMGGPAIADVVFGKANFSGKLPISIPVSGGQCPIYYAKKNTGRPANYNSWTPIEKIAVRAPQTSLGNESHHLDDGFEPLFPFGFGLSYTTFEYSNLQLSSTLILKDESIKISASISNTGKIEGYETVQLYVHDVVGSITRPVKELKAFQKVKIKPGETVNVSFNLSANDLAYYVDWNNKIIEPGLFTVWVGTDSNSGLKAQFELK